MTRETARTRRAVIAALGAAGGITLAACRPGDPGPLNPFASSKVIRVATFVGQDPVAVSTTDRMPVELQRAANLINEQRPGYEIKVDFMLLPARPTPAPPGATQATPTPFAPSALALEAAASGGDLAAGNPPPDLALITSPGDLPALLEKKLIQPLDEVLKADRSLALEEFVPGAIEASRTRGKVAMLPLAGQVHVLLCDEALFQSAGLKLPDKDWTWTALVEAARRLTRESTDARQWGILAHNQVPLLLSLIWSHGGELIARDGRRSAISEPAAREGIQLWADLLHRHRVAPIPAPGTQLIHLQSPAEIGLATIEGGSGGAVMTAAAKVTAFAPAGGAGAMFVTDGKGGGALPGSRERAAMVLSQSASSMLPGASGQRGNVIAAYVPRARSRAAMLTLVAGLSLGAAARDPRLALRAALTLSDRLQQASTADFGVPVRKPDTALLRRAQPQLSEEDAAVVAAALTESRSIAPELAPLVMSTLQQRLMAPILSAQSSVDEALRATAGALDELLRG